MKSPGGGYATQSDNTQGVTREFESKGGVPKGILLKKLTQLKE